MNSRPLISIIISCYNSSKTLNRLLDSIIEQNNINYEVILIDGLSSDNTVDIIKEYQKIFSDIGVDLTWISERDTGIYNAMNKGIDLANGVYSYFIGSDDILIKDSINKLSKFIEKNNSNNKLITMPIKVNDKNRFPVIKKNCYIIHHQGAIFKTDIIKKLKYDEINYKVHSDFNLMLIYIKNNGITYFDDSICQFNTGGESTNGKNAFRSVRELSSIYVKNRCNLFSIEFIKLISRPMYYYSKSILKK